MVSQAIQTLFIRCYTIIKLNLFFWVFSFCGGLIFGIGPAILTISELYYTYQFEYTRINFKEAWQIFKDNLIRGNQLFYIFTIVMAVLGYSLYLSVQIKGVLFIISDFILIVVLLSLICLFWYTVNILASFDIENLNAFKLATAHFFYNFFDNLKEIIGLIIILAITYKLAGLILFATIASMVVLTRAVGSNWIKYVNEIYQ